jgi:hypothetical protein
VLQTIRQSRPIRLLIPYLPRAIRERAARAATIPVQRHDVDTSDARAYLRPIQRLQTEALSRLIGRSFPEWTTLYGNDAV